MPSYETIPLSDLLNKSREKKHPDYQLAISYIRERLIGISQQSSASEFNRLGLWLQKIPVEMVFKILRRFRYDCFIMFCNEADQRKIYGMISFQKHPRKSFLGMFDIFISPHYREKNLMQNFPQIAQMVYVLCQKYCRDYHYIQCGKNRTTSAALRLYKRLARKNQWPIQVNIEDSRIYLQEGGTR